MHRLLDTRTGKVETWENYSGPIFLIKNKPTSSEKIATHGVSMETTFYCEHF